MADSLITSEKILISLDFGHRTIEDVLSDNPRSGCPGTFAPDQIARIIAVACEPPEDSGRPVTHWTPTELAEEVVTRGIVSSISVRHVGRLLKVPHSSPTGVGTG